MALGITRLGLRLFTISDGDAETIRQGGYPEPDPRFVPLATVDNITAELDEATYAKPPLIAAAPND